MTGQITTGVIVISEQTKESTGVIVGVAVGVSLGVCLAIILIFLLILFVRRRRRSLPVSKTGKEHYTLMSRIQTHLQKKHYDLFSKFLSDDIPYSEFETSEPITILGEG